MISVCKDNSTECYLTSPLAVSNRQHRSGCPSLRITSVGGYRPPVQKSRLLVTDDNRLGAIKSGTQQ